MTNAIALKDGTKVGDTVAVYYDHILVYGRVIEIVEPEDEYYAHGNVTVKLFENQSLESFAGKEVKVYGQSVMKLTGWKYQELKELLQKQLDALDNAFNEVES